MSDQVQRRNVLWGLAGAGLAASTSSAGPKPILPTITVGNKRFTRLVAGGNPIGGYSYGTPKLSEHMRNYFTVERIADFILHCEQEGISTWQSHYAPSIRDALLLARERGSRIQWIALISEQEGVFKDVLALKPVAVCHHGGVTDRMFRAGRHEEVHNFIKKVQDAGLIAGVSTHDPSHLARIEDSGWENEFYMACFYNLTRSPEELRKLVAEEWIGGYIFFKADPGKMTERIRQVKKPCLGFKILGAGRLCGNQKIVEQAFQFAYSSIKPGDGVIVGMYPAFADEIQENADHARKYAVA